ncbi:MAG: DUF929 family protein, partial [Ferroplasma sp.]
NNGKNTGKKNGKHSVKAKKSMREQFKIFSKTKSFKVTVVLAILVIAIVMVAVLYPYIAPFNAPSSITADKYYEISNKDVLSNGSSAVYFISWYGCPIGATDSWALYYAMNSSTNIYNHVKLHQAYKDDIYGNGTAGQPGLLFNGDFAFKYNSTTFNFYPLYMYNETMTGTISNGTISGTLASYGLSLINRTYPAPVAKIFNKYASDITYDNHLETTFLITGPHGTYMLNAFMYQPNSELGTGKYSTTDNTYVPHSPSYVMANLNSDTTITGASSVFMSYLGKAD